LILFCPELILDENFLEIMIIRVKTFSLSEQEKPSSRTIVATQVATHSPLGRNKVPAFFSPFKEKKGLFPQELL